MKNRSLKKLTRLGYQFWLFKGSVNSPTGIKSLFYLLKEKVLVIGKEHEFNKYPKALSSIIRIMGLNNKEVIKLKEIDKLPDKLSLIISFSEEDYKKAEKIIKFDSLGILIKDKKLKEAFIKDLQDIKL